MDNQNKHKQVMETAGSASIHSVIYYLLHSAGGRIMSVLQSVPKLQL